MSSFIPRRLTRRLPPALVATTVLAIAAAGDSVLDSGRSGVEDASVSADDAAPDGQAPAGRAQSPPPRGHGPSDGPTYGTSPDSLSPGPERLPAAAGGVAFDHELARSLTPLVVDPRVRLSVAVLAPNSGASAVFGDDLFDTASIVKVNILAALLIQAQDEGRALSMWEIQLAAAMIKHSDNDATHKLWESIGGERGLDAANRRLGLVTTAAGAGGHWGLTQTTSADQLLLLRAIYHNESPLSEESREYLRSLMADVAEEQQWGISVASDGAFELKNGWLPRTETELWDVNSIGWVSSGGQSYLIAVVSDGHTSHAAGVAAVEAAALAAVSAVSGGPSV